MCALSLDQHTFAVAPVTAVPLGLAPVCPGLVLVLEQDVDSQDERLSSALSFFGLKLT